MSGQIFEPLGLALALAPAFRYRSFRKPSLLSLHFFNERIINRQFCLLRLIDWSVILAYQIEAQVQPMTIAASQERHVQLCKEYWIAEHSAIVASTTVHS